MAEEQEIWEDVKIDRQGLLVAITETAWAAETKNKSTSELYDTWIDEGGNSRKEVCDRWASQFWSLYSAYDMLLSSYIRKPE